MRGENAPQVLNGAIDLETSPHAWRKLNVSNPLFDCLRNISTCVEKTVHECHQGKYYQKHLHMRGENHQGDHQEASHQETSPHAWRKLQQRGDAPAFPGNISTCVEKTIFSVIRDDMTRKHLHMRGENPINSSYCNSSTIYLDIILRYFCQKSKACHLLIQHNQVKNLFL